MIVSRSRAQKMVVGNLLIKADFELNFNLNLYPTVLFVCACVFDVK